MDGRTDGWMSGWMDGWMDGCLYLNTVASLSNIQILFNKSTRCVTDVFLAHLDSKSFALSEELNRPKYYKLRKGNTCKQK